MLTPPSGAASLSHGQARPGRQGPALLIAVLIIAGSVIVGLAAGAVWAAAAPRVLYQVYTLSPPTAYATNPETSAFIAADGWYCFVAVAGGALIGLVGYLFGVRRHGPAPMVGIVVGSIAAAFIAAWVGHLLSGGAGFDHLLATSRPGTFLHAPISLGSRGALAFWPLAAAGVAGGIELVGVLKARHQLPYDGTPMPGMETFGARSYPGGHSSGQLTPGQPASGQPASGQPASGQLAPGQPASGQLAPGQLTPGQPASGQPGPGQPTPSPLNSGEPSSGPPNLGQPQAARGPDVPGPPGNTEPYDGGPSRLAP